MFVLIQKMAPPFESEKNIEQNIQIDGAIVFNFAIFHVNLFYCVIFYIPFIIL